MTSFERESGGPRPDYPLVRLTLTERRRYARWWVESSGLTPLELRRIANGIWGDHIARLERHR